MARNNEGGGKSIEELRSSIEKEQRFRTAIQGYNRDDVQEYLSSLSQRYKKSIAAMDVENKRLQEERTQLLTRLESVSSELHDSERELLRLREENLSLRKSEARLREELSLTKKQLERKRNMEDNRTELVLSACDTLQDGFHDALAEVDRLLEQWKKEVDEIIR